MARRIVPRVRQPDPITVPRWALSVKYALLALIGLVAGWKGTETLRLATSADWVRGWALLLFVFSMTCAVLSLRHRWEAIERWVCIGVVALLVSFAVAVGIRAFVGGDNAVWTFAVILLALTWFPTVRMIRLLWRTGIPNG